MKQIIIVAILFIFPIFCNAQNISNADSVLDKFAGSSGAGYKNTVTANDAIDIILRTIFSLLGVFFLSLMIYGGFLWMTDRGSSQQVEKAQKLISAAVIGIIIVLASYAISYFVLQAIGDKTLLSFAGYTNYSISINLILV